jgi:hypothetical protein
MAPSSVSPVPFLLCAALLLAAPAAGQQPAPTTPASSPPAGEQQEAGEPQPPAPSPETPTSPTAPAAPAEGTGDQAGTSTAPAEGQPPATAPRRGGFLPTLDVYFPEGDLDLRTSRLVNKVFFEGQVKYNFVDGDITAFLRYRYYGFRRTYQITGFDEVEFDSIEELSGEFGRVRGLLVLTEAPHDYYRRTFFLSEIDRYTSNKESERFINNQTNTYFRLGYQIGTPDDSRSNAIVGETRAQVDRLFTPHRLIGPGDFGLTAGLTYSSDLLGDFHYVKAEVEGLKRFELGRGFFLVGRLHGGTFPFKEDLELDPEATEEVPEPDRFSIPRSELFRLDGRNGLKGLSERLRGTEELDTTWELFVPWFVDQPVKALGLEWQSWYWVLYGGYGTVGFDPEVYSDFSTYYPDAGIGFETAVRLRKYRFFLSGIVAQALRGDGDVEVRLSIKSYR